MPNAMSLITGELRGHQAALAAGRRYWELAGQWPTDLGFAVLPGCDCELCSLAAGRWLLETEALPGWYSYDADGNGSRTHAVMTDGRVLAWLAWAPEGDRPAECPNFGWCGWGIPRDVEARAAGLYVVGVNAHELRGASGLREVIVDPPPYRPSAYTATARRTRSRIQPVPLPLPD